MPKVCCALSDGECSDEDFQEQVMEAQAQLSLDELQRSTDELSEVVTRDGRRWNYMFGWLSFCVFVSSFGFLFVCLCVCCWSASGLLHPL